FFSPQNYSKHESNCKGIPFTSSSNLRDYLHRNVIQSNPRCPICSHRYVVAITSALLSGEGYKFIVSKYGHKKGQKEFNFNHLRKHKKHLNLDFVTVMERNSSIKEEEEGSGGGIGIRNKFDYMQTIARAVVDKSDKMDALIYSQLAKLEVANTLFERLRGDDIPVVIGDTAGLYLQYQKAIDDIQIKLLNMYKNVPLVSDSNVNVQILWGSIYSMQKAVLRLLIEKVVDSSLCSSLADEVGGIFNEYNNQLSQVIEGAT
ncbi:unnamed protein product, partial [marine sediment metagenome]